MENEQQSEEASPAVVTDLVAVEPSHELITE